MSNAFWNDSFWANFFWADGFWAGPTDIGETITNDTATEDTGNRYNVCQLSGFKAKPGQLIKRYDGLWVLPKFWEPRNEQDLLRAKSENQHGSIRPEPSTDQFISDLYPDGVSTDDI